MVYSQAQNLTTFTAQPCIVSHQKFPKVNNHFFFFFFLQHSDQSSWIWTESNFHYQNLVDKSLVLQCLEYQDCDVICWWQYSGGACSCVYESERLLHLQLDHWHKWERPIGIVQEKWLKGQLSAASDLERKPDYCVPTQQEMQQLPL